MDPLIGEIRLFSYSFIPEGWALCNGSILNVNSNPALFSLIGSAYGGDGKTTFALPNLLGAEPLPTMKYYIAISGIYPTRP